MYVYFIIILLLATSFGLKSHHQANILDFQVVNQ